MIFLSWMVGSALARVAPSLGRSLPVGNIQNITLHDTNPRIGYLPDTTCVPGWVYGCSSRFNPWELREYTDSSGLNRTAHFISSERNHAEGEGLREIVFSVQASAVHIYGAPRNQLQHPPADQEICVDRDPCIPLDSQNTYSNANDNEEVLIWSDSWLNPSRNHHFVIRLTEAPPGKDNPLKVMTLARVVYEIEDIYHDQPVKHIPPIGSTLRNITFEDTGYQISFWPHTACASRSSSGCSGMYSPWQAKKFEVDAGDPSVEGRRLVNETFMQALTAFPGADNVVPRAAFWFRGSALYLYGAPRSQIMNPHGAQEICIDGTCHIIDTHQLYLNTIPPRDQLSPSLSSSLSPTSMEEHSISPESTMSSDLENRSVMLWHIDGLDWNKIHHVEHRLTEENPRWGSRDGGVLKGMTLDYVVYTVVHVPPQPPPPPPSPPRSPPTSPPDQHPPPENPPNSLRDFTVIFTICFVFWTLKEIIKWKRTDGIRPDIPEPVPSYDSRYSPSERTPLRTSSSSPPAHPSPMGSYLSFDEINQIWWWFPGPQTPSTDETCADIPEPALSYGSRYSPSEPTPSSPPPAYASPRAGYCRSTISISGRGPQNHRPP